MKKADKLIPIALLDTLAYVQEQYKASRESGQSISFWLKQCFAETDFTLPNYAEQDYKQVLNFIYCYRGSEDTFNSYRRELERLLQWCWLMRKISIISLKRADIEEFIEFCQNPPLSWIGIKTVARFVDNSSLRKPNPEWRPYIVKVSKKATQDGKTPEKTNFVLSAIGVKQIFAVLGSFYNYLLQEEIVELNPVLQIRQKSKFIRKQQQAPTIRRLTDTQWQAVISVAKAMADAQPEQHERTLFIIQALYGMYLRISELAESKRWLPKMSDFFRDINGNWWFKTVGKGNKLRQIAVSPSMLEALKRWRTYLGLSALPSIDEQSPLIPRAIGKGAIASTRAVRAIVQVCFDAAVEQLKAMQKNDEAELLRSATVHWLRHTGISDDVKIRPREHVRDDAGHSSGAITDRYIDVELQARAKSAQLKG